MRTRIFNTSKKNPIDRKFAHAFNRLSANFCQQTRLFTDLFNSLPPEDFEELETKESNILNELNLNNATNQSINSNLYNRNNDGTDTQHNRSHQHRSCHIAHCTSNRKTDCQS